MQAPGRYSETLLNFAVMQSWQRPESLEAIRTLLSLGADPNYTNGKRNSSAMPNAGHPQRVEGRSIYLCSPEYMAQYARRFLWAGVKIVGGCCGTTPEHIRQIKAAVSASVTRKFIGVSLMFGGDQRLARLTTN